MKREDKNLLLQDLCSRLPHSVKCQIEGFGENFFTLKSINIDHENGHLLTFEEKINGLPIEVYLSEVKPCLFPVSSVSEEQRKEMQFLMVQDVYGILYHTIESYNYFNKNHLDTHGLILMGIAVNATNLGIYENKTITKS